MKCGIHESIRHQKQARLISHQTKIDKENTSKRTQCAVATKHLPCSLVSSFESSGFVMTSETAGFSISAGVIYLVTHNISTEVNTEQQNETMIV